MVYAFFRFDNVPCKWPVFGTAHGDTGGSGQGEQFVYRRFIDLFRFGKSCVIIVQSFHLVGLQIGRKLELVDN